MSDEKSLERLSHVDDFVALLEDLNLQKDALLQSLHGLPTEQLQQATGRLLQLDDTLRMAGWDNIVERRMKR